MQTAQSRRISRVNQESTGPTMDSVTMFNILVGVLVILDILDISCPTMPMVFCILFNNYSIIEWSVIGQLDSIYLKFVTATGVSSSRMGTEGDFLPSARQVSLGVHKDSDRPHTHLHLLAFTGLWAEFVAKDISHTAQFSGFNKSAIKCCGIAFDNFHADCYPIRIDVDDPHYSKVGDNCQEYMRSSVAPRIGCTLGLCTIRQFILCKLLIISINRSSRAN